MLVKTALGQTFHCKRVIVAIPPQQAGMFIVSGRIVHN